jgi:hypothetical protein
MERNQKYQNYTKIISIITLIYGCMSWIPDLLNILIGHYIFPYTAYQFIFIGHIVISFNFSIVIIVISIIGIIGSFGYKKTRCSEIVR